jgi:hypothetical protein
VRAVFLILLLANLGFFAWWRYGSPPDAAADPAPLDELKRNGDAGASPIMIGLELMCDGEHPLIPIGATRAHLSHLSANKTSRSISRNNYKQRNRKNRATNECPNYKVKRKDLGGLNFCIVVHPDPFHV